MATKERMTRQERRDEIVEAAIVEFAVGGLHGTSVEAIARRVGVSQPYLFQLFGTKRDLFVAAIRRGFERTLGTFRAGAAGIGPNASPEEVLEAMGLAYTRLLADRTLLLTQLQGYAACDDPKVREAVRQEFVRLLRFVSAASGAADDDIRDWLAKGMLMNVAAAMDLAQVKEEWARICLGEEAAV